MIYVKNIVRPVNKWGESLKIYVQMPIGYSSGLVEVETEPEHTLAEVKREVCAAEGINPNNMALMYGGEVLKERKTLKELGIEDGATLALMPLDIIGG